MITQRFPLAIEIDDGVSSRSRVSTAGASLELDQERIGLLVRHWAFRMGLGRTPRFAVKCVLMESHSASIVSASSAP